MMKPPPRSELSRSALARARARVCWPIAGALAAARIASTSASLRRTSSPRVRGPGEHVVERAEGHHVMAAVPAAFQAREHTREVDRPLTVQGGPARLLEEHESHGGLRSRAA